MCFSDFFKGEVTLSLLLLSFQQVLIWTVVKLHYLGVCFFLFPPHAKELVLLYEADCITVGVKQVSQIFLLWSTPPWLTMYVCVLEKIVVILVELMWHSRTVLRIIWTWMWTVGQKNIALVLLPWLEQGSDSGYVCTALCRGGQKSSCVRVGVAPAAQEKKHLADVPAQLPGPPWCVHSCECICAALCSAGGLYFTFWHKIEETWERWPERVD